jgi:hypothetical protein
MGADRTHSRSVVPSDPEIPFEEAALRASVWLFRVLVVLALPLTCGVAHAHPGHAVPIEDVESLAASIVEGDVSSVESRWNADRSQILTDVRITVRAVYRGLRPGAELRLTLLGGQVGDIVEAVLGQATFRTQQRVLVFLGPDASSTTPVVEGQHGVFEVTRDDSGREILTGFGVQRLKSDITRRIQRANAGLPRDGQ